MEKTVLIKEIEIQDRIRKNNGDLEELAKDIAKNGLINAITVMEKKEGGYLLIAGLRRLKACEMLEQKEIRVSIRPPQDADKLLLMEISENEQRKAFTPSERVRYGKLMGKVEKEKANRRMSEHARDGYKKGMDDRPSPEKGSTRDKVAEKVGFGSGRQLERATYVNDNRPDLMEKVDNGDLSVSGAYTVAKNDEKKESAQSEEAFVVPANENAPVHIGIAHPEKWKQLKMFRPIDVKPEGKGIAGADHFKLMENEIYATIYKKYEEAVQSANIVIGSFDHMRGEFDTVLRGVQNNLDTALAENKKLGKENQSLRKRLEEKGV